MNAKEAREIRDKPIHRATLGIAFKNGRAKGFLEAVEKFKPVVEALENRAHCLACVVEALENRAHCLACQTHEHPTTKESLESYRRDVLGEE